VAALRKKLKKQIKEVMFSASRVQDFAWLAEERNRGLGGALQRQRDEMGVHVQDVRAGLPSPLRLPRMERRSPSAATRAEQCRLSASEWDLVEGLPRSLRPFKEASVDCQSDQSPTLSTACGVYEWLLGYLERKDLPSGVQDAIPDMKEKLEDYFGRTGSIYYVATLLDPRFKLCWASEPGRLKADSYEKILREVTPFLEPYLQTPPESHPRSVGPVPGPTGVGLETQGGQAATRLGAAFQSLLSPQVEEGQFNLGAQELEEEEGEEEVEGEEEEQGQEEEEEAPPREVRLGDAVSG